MRDPVEAIRTHARLNWPSAHSVTLSRAVHDSDSPSGRTRATLHDARTSVHCRGMTMINFDGRTMFVSSTATTGVVGEDTRLYFKQRGQRVVARYAGGRVKRGWLVGTCIEIG